MTDEQMRELWVQILIRAYRDRDHIAAYREKLERGEKLKTFERVRWNRIMLDGGNPETWLKGETSRAMHAELGMQPVLTEEGRGEKI